MVCPYQPLVTVQGKERSNSDMSAALGAARSVPVVGLRKKRILHVEFDRTLLTTRHALLETAGFEVISCFSGTAAREVSSASANFDLFLIGHAASIHERTDLIIWIRAHFPGIAVVALRSRDTDFSPEGDAMTVADPDELLKTLLEVLRVR